jgi:hypothetical protein
VIRTIELGSTGINSGKVASIALANSRATFGPSIFGENSALTAQCWGDFTQGGGHSKGNGRLRPDAQDSEGVTAALMQAMLLRRGGSRAQRSFDFGGAPERLEAKWRDAEENAKASPCPLCAEQCARKKFAGMAGYESAQRRTSKVGQFTVGWHIGSGLENKGSPHSHAHLDHCLNR